MLDTIKNLLGDYTPVMTDRVYVDVEGVVQTYQTVADGLAGVDWPWVVSAVILCIVLYSLFRLIGGIVRG